MPVPAAADAWPLVGRELEVARARERVETGGVVIAGLAGVGKTRLLRAVATRCEESHHLEWMVASSSARGIPYGVLARLRSDRSGDPGLALRAALLARAAGRQLVLVIDDAQWLDDASAALVLDLRVNTGASVLATVRSREPEPNAITALWKDEWCERLELQPLGDRDVTALLEAALGGPVESASARALSRMSRGNVLHLRELLLSGHRTGALALRHGLWVWRGPADAPRLIELLSDRLETLGAGERRVVETVAIGEPLPWSVLTELATEAELENLVRSGMLDVLSYDQTEARLGHPLVGEVIAAAIPRPVRANICRRLSMLVREGDPVRRAAWQLAANDPAAIDLGVMLAASARCRLVDPTNGARFARVALQNGGGVTAGLLLANHLMLSHDGAEAASVVDAIDDATLSPDERVELAVERANVLTWGLGDPDGAVAGLDAAIAALGDGPSARELEAHAVPMLVFAGRVTEAIARSERMRDPEVWTPSQRLRAMLGEVAALAAAGLPVKAQARAAEAFVLVPGCVDELPIAQGQLASNYTLAQMLAGDLDGSEGLMRIGYEAALESGLALQRGGTALRLGQVALWRGRVRTAQRLLQEAIGALIEVDAGYLGWAADSLELAAALAGDHDAMREAGRIGRSAPRFGIFRTERVRAEAASSAATGDLAGSRLILRDGLAQASALGHYIQVVILAFDFARVDGATEAAAALETNPAVEGDLSQALSAAVYAMASRDPKALDAAGAALARIGVALHAAECAQLASRWHTANGFRSSAARAAAMAESLLAQCEGARSPLLQTTSLPVELTRRERTVAELAARGLSDAVIAERLGISVRTIETHLHRVYVKLGIGGRTELAAVFTPTT